MADHHSVESLHSLDSSLNNHTMLEERKQGNNESSFYEKVRAEEEKKNDDEMNPIATKDYPAKPNTPPTPTRAFMQPHLSNGDWTSVFQHQSGHNSHSATGTLDSDSIYTSDHQNQVGTPNRNNTDLMNDVEANLTSSLRSFHTPPKRGTVSLEDHPVTPTGATEGDVGSYMSVEVIDRTCAFADTPKMGHAPPEPLIQVVENHHDDRIQNMVNAQMNINQLSTREIVRQLNNVVPKEADMISPPNMVTLNENPKHHYKANPFQETSSAASTDGSLYTNGHDASTITKDTFLKQQDYLEAELDRQAYAASMMDPVAPHATRIDPEAPLQEASPDYDAYYDPNAYGNFTSQDETSVGQSTITSLTKDTGILKIEDPDGLPVSMGIMSGDLVSDLSPPRIGGKRKDHPGTPSTYRSGVVDEEYGSGAGGVGNYNKDPSSLWVFLQNATRDPTVQCLISLACIFAVILFFLVAVIIVLTSEDIQIWCALKAYSNSYHRITRSFGTKNILPLVGVVNKGIPYKKMHKNYLNKVQKK